MNALARATAAHEAAFGSRPMIGTQAPGRVNLIGEHTDYNDGFVLPMAIDRRCVAVASPGCGRVHAADLGETWTVAGRPAAGTWMSYIAGVMEGVGRLGSLPPLDITIASDVPLGTGLSSSAALEVSVAGVLIQASGAAMTPVEVARLCRRAEHEYAGVPCGIMDQMIATLGTAGHALLIDCRDESARPVSMPPAEHAAVVVMNSGVRHALTSGEYANRREICRRAANTLGVRSLRDAESGMTTSAALDADERRCLEHVLSENIRTLGMVKALEAGNLEVAGELMNASHASLRDHYRVSCPELDTLVKVACGVPGVFGARMTGGGFGGCAIALVRPHAITTLAVAVHDEYPRRHGRHADVFTVAASAAAGRVF